MLQLADLCFRLSRSYRLRHSAKQRMRHCITHMRDYATLPGFGWCQDSNGMEGVNRAFLRGNQCRKQCDTDSTCPVYARTSSHCVVYTDKAFQTRGRPAKTFQPVKAGYTANQPWWARAQCFRKPHFNPAYANY